jgi:hypothetical protein
MPPRGEVPLEEERSTREGRRWAERPDAVFLGQSKGRGPKRENHRGGRPAPPGHTPVGQEPHEGMTREPVSRERPEYRDSKRNECSPNAGTPGPELESRTDPDGSAPDRSPSTSVGGGGMVVDPPATGARARYRDQVKRRGGQTGKETKVPGVVPSGKALKRRNPMRGTPNRADGLVKSRPAVSRRGSHVGKSAMKASGGVMHRTRSFACRIPLPTVDRSGTPVRQEREPHKGPPDPSDPSDGP